MKILIASNNQHKVTEFKKILDELQNLELVTPHDLNINIVPNENGTTFEENSKIKCLEFYQVCKLPIISDDSGLEVDILNRMPGIHSARYAGLNASDKENREFLIEQLRGLESDIYTARFRCVITFYDGVILRHFEGSVEGSIIKEERGGNGFGYDAIFVPNEFNITFAEMSSEVKNNISHRAIALNKFSTFLKEYCQDGRK